MAEGFSKLIFTNDNISSAGLYVNQSDKVSKNSVLAMKDYNNYIYKIIRNKYNNFSDEDIEEIVLDVFITLWNNQNK